MGGEPALASEQRERIALRSWQHRSGEESKRGRFWVPRRPGSNLERSGFQFHAAERHSPACGSGGAVEGGMGEAEVPEGVVEGKSRAEVAEVGNQSVEGAAGEAVYALDGDDVDVDGVGVGVGVGGAKAAAYQAELMMLWTGWSGP